MEKRKLHNWLLVLAIAILLVGALVQVYFMVTQGEKGAAEKAAEITPQQEQALQ